MRVINAIDPATAADIRAAISGRPNLKTAKPKRAQPVKCYVSQFTKYDPDNDRLTIQLPVAFRTAEYNAERTPFYLREKWVKEKRELVWAACHAYLSTFDRSRVRHIEFVRLATMKLDDDNVVSAFKAVRDALCSYLVHGKDCHAHVKTIGKADDKLAKGGITWSYRQQKCESNPRLYGIRIILHCAPRS